MSINRRKLFNFFSSTFELTESTNGWYRFSSPFDKKRDQSAAVNFTYNRVKDHRSGFNASITDFLRIVTDKDYIDLKEVVEKYTEVEFKPTNIVRSVGTVKLPDHFYFLDEKVAFAERANKYMNTRNLDPGLVQSRSIGFCNDGEWFGRIIIPFMNPQLTYYIGRSFLSDPLKYRNPKKEDVGVGKSEIFYNEQALNNHEAFLCEGVFDALSCGHFGIASLGWKLSQIQTSKIISSRVQDLYIVPDKDFYQKALITAADFLEHKNVFITNLDGFEGNDINDVGIENVEFRKVTYEMLLGMQ